MLDGRVAGTEMAVVGVDTMCDAGKGTGQPEIAETLTFLCMRHALPLHVGTAGILSQQCGAQQ